MIVFSLVVEVARFHSNLSFWGELVISGLCPVEWFELKTHGRADDGLL